MCEKKIKEHFVLASMKNIRYQIYAHLCQVSGDAYLVKNVHPE